MPRPTSWATAPVTSGYQNSGSQYAKAFAIVWLSTGRRYQPDKLVNDVRKVLRRGKLVVPGA